MKYIPAIITTIAIGLFLMLSIYSYQHRITTLAQLIDRSNAQLVEHKMAELYGE